MTLKTNIEHTTLEDLLLNPDDQTVFEVANPQEDLLNKRDEYLIKLHYALAVDQETIAASCPFVVRFELDQMKLHNKQINIGMILKHLETCLKSKNAIVICSDMNSPDFVIRVRLLQTSDPKPRNEMLSLTQEMERKLRNVLILGIPESKLKITGSGSTSTPLKVSKVFVEQDENEYYLETEGSNLRDIMNYPEVDFKRTTSNNPLEIVQILGIEAGRKAIKKEIQEVMEYYDITVNDRHLGLLADTMTHRGVIMSTTRHGINRSDRSPLTKCTFEETVKFLLQAARNSSVDPLESVSPNIMLGKLAPIGSGTFDLLFNSGGPPMTMPGAQDLPPVVQDLPPVEEYDPENAIMTEAPRAIDPVEEYDPENTIMTEAAPRAIDPVEEYDPENAIMTDVYTGGGVPDVPSEPQEYDPKKAAFDFL